MGTEAKNAPNFPGLRENSKCYHTFMKKIIGSSTIASNPII